MLEENYSLIEVCKNGEHIASQDVSLIETVKFLAGGEKISKKRQKKEHGICMHQKSKKKTTYASIIVLKFEKRKSDLLLHSRY